MIKLLNTERVVKPNNKYYAHAEFGSGDILNGMALNSERNDMAIAYFKNISEAKPIGVYSHEEEMCLEDLKPEIRMDFYNFNSAIAVLDTMVDVVEHMNKYTVPTKSSFNQKLVIEIFERLRKVTDEILTKAYRMDGYEVAKQLEELSKSGPCVVKKDE